MPGNPIRAQEILLPVRPGFIVFTLIAGYFLNLLPLDSLLGRALPDFVALLLIYWSIYKPANVGIGSGWLLGVLMDVADTTLFGQHAAAYSIMCFLAISYGRRIRMFEPGQQMLHVMALVLSSQITMVLIGLAAKGTFPGWLYFSASITTGLLWPVFSHLLKLPQRTKPDHPTRI